MDLVEVTAHAVARPSHAEWQGQVYSPTGRTRGYEKLADATGYGTGEGLGGWNCRHSFFPWSPEMGHTYTRKELEEYERPDAVEYGGRKMSLYEAEQTQRGMERNIRRWKREESAMKAAGLEAAEASGRLKQWNSRYKDFCSKTGLKPQSGRLSTQMKTVAKPGKSGIIKSKKNGMLVDIQFFGNKGIEKQTDKELKKSLNSWKKRVIEHQLKIENPEKFDSGWNDKSDRHKDGLIKHWKKEIQTFEKNIAQAKDELKKRGGSDE